MKCSQVVVRVVEVQGVVFENCWRLEEQKYSSSPDVCYTATIIFTIFIEEGVVHSDEPRSTHTGGIEHSV